jgi:N-acetylmuramic acid 6-phosphate etherase
VSVTEGRNPKARNLDMLSVREILQLMNEEDRTVADAVGAVLGQVAEAVDLVAGSLATGGRLFYAGAGTSGRIALLDAAECRPTFGTPPELVQVLIAGGESVFAQAHEGVEDDFKLGMDDARARGIAGLDAVVGVSASGNARYVLGVLTYARREGAATIGLTCNPSSAMDDLVDVAITPVVGPEVVMGSSRLKAGTAQKMVLNMISTASMVKLGRVYQDLMIELRPANRKLAGRTRRIVSIAAGVDDEAADRLIEQAEGNLKAAVLMAKNGGRLDHAKAVLDRAGNNLRAALELIESGNAGE